MKVGIKHQEVSLVSPSCRWPGVGASTLPGLGSPWPELTPQHQHQPLSQHKALVASVLGMEPEKTRLPLLRRVTFPPTVRPRHQAAPSEGADTPLSRAE